ncbi:MAG: SurA N-terminal domain-containing protein [Cyclobacteriaceae bacterium]
MKAGKIVVGVVAFSMVAFILTDLLQGNSSLFGGGNNVGEINGETISYQQFTQKLDQMAYNFQLNTGRSPQSEDIEQLRQQAWQELIVNNVFQPEFEKLGIEVTSAELVDMVQGNNIHPQIQQLFADPNTGMFQKQNIVSFLQQINSAPVQQRESWLAFEASLAPNRQLNKYENLLELTKYANKYEAKSEYEKGATVNLDYLYVPFFSISDSTVDVADSELKSYLSENSNEYQREESRDAIYVAFDIVPSADDSAIVKNEVADLRDGLINSADDSTYALINSEGLTPFGVYKPNNFPSWLSTEEEALEVGYVSEPTLIDGTYTFYKVTDIYEGDEQFVKASHILVKWNDESAASKATAKTEARRILDAIKGGADFGDQARIYGTDGTAQSGGDLGWFGENSSFVQEFKDAVFAFDGTGLLRDVVETDFGFHIIEVTEAKTSDVYKIASIEKPLFVSDETQNQIYREVQLFASDAQSISNFRAKASEVGAAIRTASRVGKNDKRLGGIAEARTVVFWMYNEASLGDISEVFELANDQYIVAALTGVQEKGTARLSDVRNEISRKVRDEKKSEIIVNKLNGLSGTYEEIKTAYGEGARTGTTDITFSTNSFPGIGFAPGAIGLAFSLEEGESTRAFKTQNGVLLMTVNTKNYPAEIANYDAYRAVFVGNQRSFRRRETPFTFQNIYNALSEGADIEDERYKFY